MTLVDKGSRIQPAVEEALAAIARNSGKGLEHLVSVAFAAGKHGEVSYADFLDSWTDGLYRGRLRTQRTRQLRAAAAAAANQE